jgi:RsbT co-antagonist protein rsbRD N-terminal domain
MEMKNTTALPRLLAENEDALLSGWLQSQKKSGALRGGQISEMELGENSRHSRQLLAALRQGAATGQFEDIAAPGSDQARTVLDALSRSRAALGLTPSEAASVLTHSLDSQGRRDLRYWLMAQSVCVIVSAADRERLQAIAGERNRPRKHAFATLRRYSMD